MNHKIHNFIPSAPVTPDARFVLKQAEKYCDLTGIAPATLSTKLMNDGKFLDRVMEGKGFTSKSFYKIKHWFAANMPRTETAAKRNMNSAQALITND